MAKREIGFLKETFSSFSDDEAMTWAASVAYYAALALAPLVLLFIAITGFFGESTRQGMIRSVQDGVGKQAGQVVQAIAARSEGQAGQATLSLVISLAVLAFSASGVLSALQSGLNHIWNVKAAPGQGIKGWLRKRLLSMAMVLAIFFLLLVSMILSSVMDMMMPSSLPGGSFINLGVSFVVFTLLFAAMFKVLPDVKIAWSDVWLGAAITSLLFAVGKFLIGLYIARADFSKSYGAAGSVIALLVWVYYGAVMLFFGAEVTQVMAHGAAGAFSPISTRFGTSWSRSLKARHLGRLLREQPLITLAMTRNYRRTNLKPAK